MSDFADLASQAHEAVETVYGDPVTIGTTEGTAIVIPQDDLMLGSGVEMVGGALMTYRVADFPDVHVHDTVTVGDTDYAIVELDDVSLAGIRRARLAPS